MSLKIKALLQILSITVVGMATGLILAFYNRLVGDVNTLYTIAAITMAALFYSMYRLLLNRLEYEEELKKISDTIDRITNNK